MKDALQAKIEELTKLPGLAPETVMLIQMALEAQRIRKMPPIPKAGEKANKEKL